MKIEIDIKKEKLIWIIIAIFGIAIFFVAFVVGGKLGSERIKTHVDGYDFLSPESNLEVMIVKYKFINTRESGKNNLRVTEYHAEIPFFVNVKSVDRSGGVVNCDANLTVGKPVIKDQKVIAEVERNLIGDGSGSEGVKKGIEEDKKLEDEILKEIQSNFLLMDEAKKQARVLLKEYIKRLDTNENVQVIFEE